MLVNEHLHAISRETAAFGLKRIRFRWEQINLACRMKIHQTILFFFVPALSKKIDTGTLGKSTFIPRAFFAASWRFIGVLAKSQLLLYRPRSHDRKSFILLIISGYIFSYLCLLLFSQRVKKLFFVEKFLRL